VLDEAGHHKKLEDYFVNEKVPARQRDHRLLVTQDSKVLWIVGGRMGYGAGISQETQIVLEITCEGGKSNGLQ
jgi:tRNA(Ile)-lysidine synthase